MAGYVCICCFLSPPLLSLSLLLHGLSARWYPCHISRNVSISSCLSPIPIGCRYSCRTSPLGRPSIFFSIYLFLFLPSVMPKTICLISLSSGIRHTWPKKFSFLSITFCTMLALMPSLFIISLFLIFFAILCLISFVDILF